MAKQDWQRLSDYVVSRRTEIGLKTRRDLSRATDGAVTDRTIGKLENGDSVSQSTISAIERVLGWEPGSARRILDGGEPALPDRQTPQPAYSDPVMQRAWERLADVDLPDDVKRGMIAYARARQEENHSRRTG